MMNSIAAKGTRWLSAFALVAIVPSTSIAQAAPRIDETLFATSTSDPKLLESIRAAFPTVSIIRASYVQRRFVPGLTKPLESRGSFIYSSADGLAWIQSIPFRTAHIISERGLVQKQFRGTDTKVLPAPDVTDTKRFALLMRALFRGDVTALEPFADVSVRGSSSDWHAGITIRDPGLTRFVRRIETSGAPLVTRTLVEEASGDTVETQFDQFDRSGKELTTEERGIFSW